MTYHMMRTPKQNIKGSATSHMNPMPSRPYRVSISRIMSAPMIRRCRSILVKTMSGLSVEACKRLSPPDAIDKLPRFERGGSPCLDLGLSVCP